MVPNRTIEELVKQSRAALKEDKARAEAFEGLLKHPGWATYQGLLNAILGSMGSDVLAPAQTIDGAVALEYVKGTMRGLILARDLPSATIESIKGLSTSADGEE